MEEEYRQQIEILKVFKVKDTCMVLAEIMNNIYLVLDVLVVVADVLGMETVQVR